MTDRASELYGRTRSPACTISFLPALVCYALFSIAEHRHHARRALSNNTTHHVYILLPMSRSSHLQNAWVVRYGQQVTRFVATRVGAWARAIIVGAAVEVVEEAHRVVVIRAARCASFRFYFCGADVLQSERGVHAFPGRVPSRRHRKKPLPCVRCARPRRLDLGRGPPVQPGNPLAGKCSRFYGLFYLLEYSLTTCHVAGRFGSPRLASLGGGGGGGGVLPRRRRQR